MKKATLEVRDLFGMLDFAAAEKRLSALPGVAMNAGSASATIEFDEARTNTESLAREIETCGSHRRGETVPRHLCMSGNALLLKRTRLEGLRPAAASTAASAAHEQPTGAPV